MDGLILEDGDMKQVSLGSGVLVGLWLRMGKLYVDTFTMTGYSTSNKSSM